MNETTLASTAARASFALRCSSAALLTLALSACKSDAFDRASEPNALDVNRAWYVYDVRHLAAHELGNRACADVAAIGPVEDMPVIISSGQQRNQLIVRARRERMSAVIAVLERYDVLDCEDVLERQHVAGPQAAPR